MNNNSSFSEDIKFNINYDIKKICIIAGEPSGDLLGSKLIKELKLTFPSAKFCGVGGELMKNQGLATIFPMEDLSVMGIAEVIPHLPIILKRLKQTAEYIKNQQPEIVVTIDSPDFCFRLIKKIHHLRAIKKIHLIAPSVWAYRQGRAKKIAKLYDLLLAILPFEPPYFEKYGLKTVFIGHPIIDSAPDFSKRDEIRKNFRNQIRISENDFLLCLTPGSRNSEVKKILPEMIGAVNDLYLEKSDLKIAIPLVNKTSNLVKKLSQEIKAPYFLIENTNKESLFFASDFAVAKSGTNTIELSLYRLAMIVCYKVNYFTYYLLKMLIKIKFANLINLILNREVIPELLQKKCSSKEIFLQLNKFIGDDNLQKKQIYESNLALEIMGLNSKFSASKKASNAIFEILKK
jgi:lipid-A-disaccharide synthase